MRFRMIVVGKTRVSYLCEGEEDYLKRLRQYCRFDIQHVKSEKIKDSIAEEQIRHCEGERILKLISPRSTVVAMDTRGETMSSEDLARKVADWQNRGIPEVVFLIGGPLGLSDAVWTRANYVFSLSRMTLTHEMARLILLEQLYRSFTILRGEKYHK